MSKSFRIALLGFIGIAVAGCSSTTSSMSNVSPMPRTSVTALAAEGTQTVGYAPQTGLAEAAEIEKPYYIEFRSRSAESYGHTFAMFGRQDAQGHLLTREVAGLHPASTSDVPYVLGHLIPVPSETGASDGDLEDQYMTAKYHIDLTPAEYNDVVAYIRDLQASSPVWHAVLYNCSAFVGDIAEHMGLRTPSPLLFPENYINGIRNLNS